MNKRRIIAIGGIVLFLLLFLGIRLAFSGGENGTDDRYTAEYEEAGKADDVTATAAPTEAPTEITPTETAPTEAAPTEAPVAEPTQAEAVTAGPDINGIYSSRDEVALYIHTYGKLPVNYITKKDAKALGWDGGSLEPYAPGKCIGGDHFGNYEGLLPDGDYHECDIDTLGKSKRGAKRIIYDADGDIYYTEDHYESFIQLY